MRLLYITDENLEDSEHVGIKKKIRGQLTALDKNGIQAECVFRKLFMNQLVDASLTQKIEYHVTFTETEYYEYIYQLLTNRKIDILYIRHMLATEDEILFFRKIKETTDIRVYLDIPTYPYDDVYRKGWMGSYRLGEDSYWSDYYRSYVDQIITYGDEDRIFHMKPIHLTNGIDRNSICTGTRKKEAGEFRFLCVSTLARWHGYERVLYGMAEYKKHGDKRVLFDLVGDGLEKERLMAISKELGLEEDVTFHGIIEDENELQALYSNADVGVAGLAPFRIGVYDCGGGIKNQEYVARGLPFIIAISDQRYEKESFMKCVGNTDEPICIDEVIRFIEGLDMESERKRMKHIAETKLVWDVIMQELISSMKSTNPSRK